MTSIDTPNNPEAKRRITTKAIVSAATIAIYDREQAVRDQYYDWDGDVFDESIHNIVEHLRRHQWGEELISAETFGNWERKVSQEAEKERLRGHEEGSWALGVLHEALKLLQHVGEDETSPDSNQADLACRQGLVEKGFKNMVELLERAGMTKREVEDRIFEFPHLG